MFSVYLEEYNQPLYEIVILDEPAEEQGIHMEAREYLCGSHEADVDSTTVFSEKSLSFCNNSDIIHRRSIS